MRNNILLTGLPKSGKSTMLERIVAKKSNSFGLLTKEIREDGERTGFEAITHEGLSTIIASTNFQTDIQVSKYFVNIENLNKIIPSISKFKSENLLYLDEIGLMQMYSKDFQELASKYLKSQNVCIATIKIYDNEFLNMVRNRNDVILVEITPKNRDIKYDFVSQLIGKIHKAERYSSEPKRFDIHKNKTIISTDHGEKHLERNKGIWSCDCHFYDRNNICSHVLALEDFMRYL